MSKRRADKQLTQDNWDEETSDVEEPADPQVAPEEVLNKRVIKKARRRINKDQSPGASTASPFAMFAGFGGSSAATNGSHGGGFSAPSPTTTQTATASTGSTSGSNPFAFLAAASTTAASSSASSGASTAASPFQRPAAVSAGLTTPTPRAAIRRASSSPGDYHRQLRALNQCLLDWVQKHVRDDPCCVLTPVFADYDRHLNTIETQFGGAVESSASSRDPPAAQEAKLNGDGHRDSGGDSGEMAGFVAGAFDRKDNPLGLMSSSAASPQLQTFTFGAVSSPTTDSSGGKSSSLNAVNSVAGGAPAFGAGFFGFNKTNSGGSDTAPPAEGPGEEETDEPPVPVVSVVQEEDSLYSKRCKLFYKKDGGYVEKGVGMLHLKPCGDKTQLLIRADTNLGNILLNIKLNPSIPTQRMGKNNVMLACVPNPPLDPRDTAPAAPTPLLIRVKSADDADQLLAKLQELKQ